MRAAFCRPDRAYTGLLIGMTTVIRNRSGHLYIIGEPPPLEWENLVYLKLKLLLSPLEMVLWLLPKIVFHCVSHQGCHNLCIDLPVVGLALPPALGDFL